MLRKTIIILLGFLYVCFVSSCAEPFIQTVQQPINKESIAPEITTQKNGQDEKQSQKYMVSSANPLASQAGLEILRNGGNAVDAAIAVQMMLNVVEPQSSGIGGGLFALYYDHQKNQLFSIDGREKAPQKIRDNVFLDASGKPLDYFTALVGGHSVGVPGVLKSLELLHKDHGHLAWKDLFQPAIKAARNGFQFGQRLHDLLETTSTVQNVSSIQNTFYKDDHVFPAGILFYNRPLADALSKIADLGSDVFYHGDLAKDIVSAVKMASHDETTLSLQDLSQYDAKYRNPLCQKYREYQVCGMGPPTSGGLTVLQILGILENQDLANTYSWMSPELVHLFAEAVKLAMADRAKYIADPDFVDVPVKQLLDKSYLRKRYDLIQPMAAKNVQAGNLETSNQTNVVQFDSLELPSTSHFSIVDGEGNAIAVTTSIEYAFGSTVMADGFLLNNQLTDFSFVSQINGTPVANRIEPGKRPRSSMSPVMVFDRDGHLKYVLGSPGGSRIIQYVAKTLIALLDYHLGMQQAINEPHFVTMDDAIELEKGTSLVKLVTPLKNKGHDIKIVDLNSGLHGIEIDSGSLKGGADSRREGLVLGD